MTESYKRGFVNRCLERGVDPNAVVKYAEYVNAREAAKNQKLTKSAKDINFATAPNMGYAGAGAGAAGAAAGAAAAGAAAAGTAFLRLMILPMMRITHISKTSPKNTTR